MTDHNRIDVDTWSPSLLASIHHEAAMVQAYASSVLTAIDTVHWLPYWPCPQILEFPNELPPLTLVATRAKLPSTISYMYHRCKVLASGPMRTLIKILKRCQSGIITQTAQRIIDRETSRKSGNLAARNLTNLKRGIVDVGKFLTNMREEIDHSVEQSRQHPAHSRHYIGRLLNHGTLAQWVEQMKMYESTMRDYEMQLLRRDMKSLEEKQKAYDARQYIQKYAWGMGRTSRLGQSRRFEHKPRTWRARCRKPGRRSVLFERTLPIPGDKWLNESFLGCQAPCNSR